MPPYQEKAVPPSATADPFEDEDALMSSSQADSVCDSLTSSNATSKAGRPATPSSASSFRFSTIFFPTSAHQTQAQIPNYINDLSVDIRQHFIDEWKVLRPESLEDFLAKTPYFNRRTLLEELNDEYITELSSQLFNEARYLRNLEMSRKRNFSSSSSWSMKVSIFSIMLAIFIYLPHLGFSRCCNHEGVLLSDGQHVQVG